MLTYFERMVCNLKMEVLNVFHTRSEADPLLGSCLRLCGSWMGSLLVLSVSSYISDGSLYVSGGLLPVLGALTLVRVPRHCLPLITDPNFYVFGPVVYLLLFTII